MRWLALRLVLAVFTALIALAPGHAYTCADALQYRAEILNLTADQRRQWIRALRLTRKQVRQARACLRGR